jgi:hypothetical protein
VGEHSEKTRRAFGEQWEKLEEYSENTGRVLGENDADPWKTGRSVHQEYEN